MFQRNNVKVSYCCKQNVGNIKSHNQKLINSSYHHEQPHNCRQKEDAEKPPKLKSYPRKCSRKFLKQQNPLKFSKNTPENPQNFLLCDFFFNFFKFSHIKSIFHFRHLFSFLYLSSQISLLQTILVSKVSGLNNQYSVQKKHFQNNTFLNPLFHNTEKFNYNNQSI